MTLYQATARHLALISVFLQLPPQQTLGLNIWLSTSNKLLELEEAGGKSNIGLQEILGIHAIGFGIRSVLLDIQSDGCATASGARQTNNNSASVIEFDVETLILAYAAIEIGVREITCIAYNAVLDLGAGERLVGNQVLQSLYDFCGTIAVHILVIVSGEESSTIDSPEVVLDLSNAWGNIWVSLANTGNDVQPSNDSPQTILLTNVITTITETLLSTNRQLVSIEECTKEFPSSWNFVGV